MAYPKRSLIMSHKIVQVLLDRSKHQPNDIAYTYLIDGESKEDNITYKELCEEAERIAVFLQARYHKGDKIIISMPSSIEVLKLIYGTLMAGMIVVSCNTVKDITFDERIQSMLDDTDIRFIITSPEAKHVMMSKNIEVLTLDDINDVEGHVEHHYQKQDLAVIQYTSGSTSNPKGVEITYENIDYNNELIFNQIDNKPGTIVSWLPVHHDMCLMANIFFAMYSGVRCIMMSPSHFLRKPVRWLKAISKYKGILSASPNFGYKWCVQNISSAEMDSIDLSTWRVALNAAEPIDEQVIFEFEHKFKDCNFSNRAWMIGYGMAEATLFISGSLIDDRPKLLNVSNKSIEAGEIKVTNTSQEPFSTFVSVGKPLIETSIVNEEGHVLHEKKIGEIVIKGKNVFTKYINQDHADHRINHYFRTGDIGFIYEDELYITGRKKDSIIIKGTNYHPEDLEKKLGHEVEDLLYLDRVFISSLINGEERIILIQEIERKKLDENKKLVSSIKNVINKNYGLDIHEIVFVKKHFLPKTSSGKVRRNLVKNMYRSNQLKYIKSIKIEENKVDLESNLENFIEKLLGQSINELNSLEPLIYYGLDSIKFVRLQEYIYNNLHKELNASSISEVTLDDLTTLSDIHQSIESNDKEFSLSHSLESIWFQTEMRGNTYYNLDYLFEIDNLDIKKLEEAINQVIQNHPILRAGFYQKKFTVYGYISDFSSILIDVLHTSESNFDKILDEALSEKFMLNHPPLIKCKVIRTENKEYLLFRIHHIITDLWSVNLLFKEIKQLYEDNKTTLLPSVDQINFFSPQDGITSIYKNNNTEYFKGLFNKIEPLKLDIENGSTIPKGNSTAVKKSVPMNLYEKIKEFIVKYGFSEENIYKSVYIILLQRYSHKNIISIASPYHGRTDPKTFLSQGNFVQTLPLFVEYDDTDSFLDILKKVERNYLEVLKKITQDNGYSYENYLKFENSNFNINHLFSYRSIPFLEKMDNIDLNSNLKIGESNLCLARREKLEKNTLYNIDLLIEPSNNGTEIWIKYDYSLFKYIDIKNFLENYFFVLERLISFPENKVSNFSLVPENKILSIVNREMNGTYKKSQTVKSEIMKQLIHQGDTVATILGESHETYEELQKKSNKLSEILKRL